MNLFKGDDGRYHYIYITVNKANGKKYLGKHSTKSLNDGYIGNGIFKWTKNINGIGFKGAVKKYGYDNFESIMLLCFSSSELAFRAERLLGFLLKVKERKDFYNISFCGETGSGNLGKKHSFKTKKKISDNKKRSYALNIYAPWNKGKKGIMAAPWNKGTKGIVKAWNKGQKGVMPDPWNKGKPMSEEDKVILRINSSFRKIILQFDLNGNVVKEWFSQEEAVRNGFKGVSSCCNHKTNSCKGFIWIFKEEYCLNKNIFKDKLSKLNIVDGKIRAWNANKKDVFSEKTKEIWSKQRKGVKLSEETKKKISKSVIKSMTDEVRNKIRIKVKESSKKRKIVICPHCQKEGILNNMMRWHFNNCKFKNNDNISN